MEYCQPPKINIMKHIKTFLIFVVLVIATSLRVSIAAVSPAHSLMIDSNGNVLNTNSNITFNNVKVAGIVGDGSGLTNLNGSDITSGTVSNAALSSDVRQQLALAGSTNSILNDVDAVAYATRTGVS